MKLSIENVWVVFYDASSGLDVFDNEQEAENYKNKQKDNWPALDWRVEKLSEYGFICFEKGLKER